jgi:hypothetical protein
VKPSVYGAIVWKYVKLKVIWLSEKVIVNGMKTYLRKIWRLWAKSLGEKSGSTDAEADRIACIRTVIVLCYILTNCFIVAGVIHHW